MMSNGEGKQLQTYAAMPIAVILVNWNGWANTIECLESVLKLNYPSFYVIVCDNHSTDGSLEKIIEWANGSTVAQASKGLARLVTPPVEKPVAFVSPGGNHKRSIASCSDPLLVLLDTGANLGFAGGNNVGIRYALLRDDCKYVWLLNNDTVVEPDALLAMVRVAEQNPRLGVCGSVLCAYAAPHDVLTRGGRRYSRWTGRTFALQDPSVPTKWPMKGSPDYVEGASMLISRRCLEQVGLLTEDYFLYCEEVDFVARLGPEFDHGYAVDSIVYHKEGASIGSSGLRSRRSSLSDFYLARNRILFTRRYHPWMVVPVALAVVASALQRLWAGRGANVLSILRGALAGARHQREPLSIQPSEYP